MKRGLTIIISIFILHNSFGQKGFQIKGELISCLDSSELVFGFVHIMQKDSIIESACTNDNAQFVFEGLKEGSYELVTDYFYFPSTKREIRVSTDMNLQLCLTPPDSNTMFLHYKPQPAYTIYYYGLAKYSDKHLNEIGKSYGVRWKNLGCISDDKFDRYNEMVFKILNYRNGEAWEDNFWSEVKQKWN